MKNGWRTKKIGDVCQLMTGGTPSRASKGNFDGNIPWLVSGDIHQGEIFECEGRISDAGMKASNAKLLPINSVMIALNGQGKTRGTVALLRSPATCNQSLVSIHPKNPDELMPEFLYANLHGRYQEIRQMTGDSGNDRRGLNMNLIRSIEIPIAPLPEQKRIVAILDEAFEGIATAKANAEKNLQNARAIFESHLEGTYSQRGPGWVETKLGTLFEIGSSKRIYEKDWTNSGVPFYGGRELVKLAKHGTVISNVYISNEKFTEYSRKYDMPKKGDLLITARGTIGIGFVVQDDERFYYKDGNVISLRPIAPLNPFFFLYSFQAMHSTDQFGGLTGATVRHLSLEKAKQLSLYVPNHETQNLVVKQIGSVKAECHRLVKIYEQKLAKLDALKSSLLHRAFAGELTANRISELIEVVA